MKTYLMPGYNYRSDDYREVDHAADAWYIRLAVQRFRAHGLDAEVVDFGWRGDVSTLPAKEAAFFEKIEQDPAETIALAAISASGHEALKAKQVYPKKIGKIATFSAPVNLEKMDPVKLKRYPLLERSLQDFSLDGLPVEDVMTYRGLYDQVVSVDAMVVPGAVDHRIWAPNHAGAIGWTLLTHSRQIARFLRS